MIKKMVDKFLYLVTKRSIWVEIVGIIVFVLGTLCWIFKTNGAAFDFGNFDSWWGKWLDPFTGLSTFLVALIIWVLNRAKDWEDRLPKLLDVTYKLNGHDVIICKNATLAHESDIRNWGQQLGLQTIGGTIRYFNLQQKFEIKVLDIKHQKDEYHKPYTATFYLRDNSGEIRLDEACFEFDAKFPEKGTILTNFDPNNKKIKEEIKDDKPNRIEFTVDFRDGYGILKFSLAESITPNDLKNLIPEKAKNKLFSGKGIVLSGRGPIWLYGYLVHYYHATKWVATHDPRLKGAVVVESHNADVSVGDIIPLDR